jgi:hypothetical protein
LQPVHRGLGEEWVGATSSTAMSRVAAKGMASARPTVSIRTA